LTIPLDLSANSNKEPVKVAVEGAGQGSFHCANPEKEVVGSGAKRATNNEPRNIRVCAANNAGMA
jgi:hypothetical protein